MVSLPNIYVPKILTRKHIRIYIDYKGGCVMVPLFGQRKCIYTYASLYRLCQDFKQMVKFEGFLQGICIGQVLYKGIRIQLKSVYCDISSYIAETALKRVDFAVKTSGTRSIVYSSNCMRNGKGIYLANLLLLRNKFGFICLALQQVFVAFIFVQNFSILQKQGFGFRNAIAA